MNILFIEDDNIETMKMQRTVSKLAVDHNITEAKNGEEALNFLKSNSDLPDIILLDLNMPKMNGLEFLHAIRQDTLLKRTPVIVLTTSDEDRDRIEAYNLNVAGYILKPVTFINFAEVMVALNKYWALCEMP